MRRELEKYGAYLLKKHHSNNTVASYVGDIRAFSRFVLQSEPSEKSWKEITVDDAQGYCQSLVNAEKSHRSVNRAITSLRLFYDFLLIRREVEDNPFRVIPHLKQRPESPDVLSEKEAALVVGAPMREYQALVDTLSGEEPRQRGKYVFVRDQWILEVLYYSGLKVYELTTLRDENVDDKILTLRITGKVGRNKGRSISIPQCLVNTHKEYVRLRNVYWPEIALKKNPISLRNNYGQPASRSLVWRVTVKYAQKSGLRSGLSPEVFRNTFTLRTMRSGANTELLQYLLGLEDLSTARTCFDRYQNLLLESDA